MTPLKFVVNSGACLLILLSSGIITWLTRSLAGLSHLSSAVVFAVGIIPATVLLHRSVLTCAKPHPGIYSPRSRAATAVIWELLAFTRITLLPMDGLIPFPLRVPFLRCLGLRTSPGQIAMAGTVCDPYLVSIGGGSRIGADSMLLPHIWLNGDVLVLGPIDVGPRVLVGARSIILPGVTIGEGAMVNAMSLVPMNTRIGPGEVWGGNPARLLSTPRGADAVALSKQAPARLKEAS